MEDTLSQLEDGLLGLGNCAPNVMLNSGYQHGRQVYVQHLNQDWYSVLNYHYDIGLLNQIHRTCCLQ